MRIVTTLAASAAALSLAACGTTDAETADADAMGDSTAMAMEEPMMMPVTVTVEGVQPGGGQLWIALQNAEEFATAGGSYTAKVAADMETVTATMEDVEPGTYVAAVIHDENNDGKVDVGAKGPSEAWGMSGSEQSGKPEWMPATFVVTDEGGAATVTLSYD